MLTRQNKSDYDFALSLLHDCVLQSATLYEVNLHT